MNPLRLSPLLLLLAALAACRSTGGDAVQNSWPPIESAELGEMHNVSVAGEVWFGGVPTVEDLDLAQRRGIVTVIDLCTPNELPEEYDLAFTCRELGLERVGVAVLDDETITDETVDQVLAVLEDEDRSPKLVFCGTGSRSAMFFAVYRVVSCGVPLDVALVEARRAGMKPGAPEAFVRRQVERLRAQ